MDIEIESNAKEEKEKKRVEFRYDCRTRASTLDRTSSFLSSSARVMCINVELN